MDGGVGPARGAGGSDARAASVAVPSSATSSAASRSCSVKRSSMAPSIFIDRTTAPVAASISRAVIRSWSPSRWYPPVTSHRAPRRRPTSRTAASPTRHRAGDAGRAHRVPDGLAGDDVDRGGALEVGHQRIGDTSPDPVVTRCTADVVERNDGEHVRAVTRWGPDTLRGHRWPPPTRQTPIQSRRTKRRAPAARRLRWFVISCG